MYKFTQTFITLTTEEKNDVLAYLVMRINEKKEKRSETLKVFEKT